VAAGRSRRNLPLRMVHMMYRLPGLALIVICLLLIPWDTAAAAAAAEYGTMASQKAAGAAETQKVGAATGNNLGAAANKMSHKKKKAKR